MDGTIEIQNGVLKGEIHTSGSLYGIICSDGELNGSLSIPVGYDDYTGEYEITPKVNEQELKTKDKHMVKDLLIKAIPYYEVENVYNGQTVIIGG